MKMPRQTRQSKHSLWWLLAVIATAALALPGCAIAGSAAIPADIAPSASASSVKAAIAQLSMIEIKGRAPKTGYSRAQFGPAWSDVDKNGCDTRNDILRRDLTSVTLKAGTHNCVVASGTLDDPYTGQKISFHRGSTSSALVQVDHRVPLSDAWQKGAQSWTAEKRLQFANDVRNLLSVSGASNSAKGDGDLATWLPKNRAYWCEYAIGIVKVKTIYRLWMTAAEHSRAGQLLQKCLSTPEQADGAKS